MAGVRAYIFSPPGSPSCPPDAVNGCYNTGHIDTDAPAGQSCLNPDPQQFGSLQDLIAYANSHGESLRQFNSVAEINAVCGASPVQVAPAGSPSSSGVSACGMGLCGPTSTATVGGGGTPSATTAAPGGGASPSNPYTPVVTSSPSGQTTVQAGGQASTSPFSGSFSGGSSGFGVATAAKGTGASVTTAATATKAATGVTVSGFDIVAFIKSPLGILLIVLLLVILMLTRKGG